MKLRKDQAYMKRINLILSSIKNNPGEKIADLGCGIGNITQHIYKNFPNRKIYGFKLSVIAGT